MLCPHSQLEDSWDLGERQPLLGLKTSINSLPSPPSPATPRSGKVSGYLKSTLLLVNITLGAGMFNLPYALLRSGGILSSLLVQAFILIFIGASMVAIAKVAITTGSSTYSSGITMLCGKKVGLVASALLLVYMYGASIVNIIIIGDQFEKALYSIFGGADFCGRWYLHQGFTVPTVVMVFVLPFCFFKRMDSLSFVSGVGALTMVFLVGVVIWKFVETGRPPDANYPVRPEPFTDAFWLVPAICFSYMCHPEIIPVVSCLEKPTLGEASKVVCSSLVICTVVNTGVAVLGFLSFGDKLHDDLLLAYRDDTVIQAAQFLIAVKTLATAPVFVYVIRTSLDSLVHELCSIKEASSPWKERAIRYSESVIILTSTTILAVVIPTMGYAIQVIGILGIPVIFIFPGLCLFRMGKSQKGNRKCYHWLAAFTLIVAGLVVIAAAIGNSAQDLLFPAKVNQLRAQALC